MNRSPSEPISLAKRNTRSGRWPRTRTAARFSRSATLCEKCSSKCGCDEMGEGPQRPDDRRVPLTALRRLPHYMPQLKIRELPQDERPREKLLARGADALSKSELIAILLRTGREKANAVEVARELMEKYRSLEGLSRCSVEELRSEGNRSGQ